MLCVSRDIPVKICILPSRKNWLSADFFLFAPVFPRRWSIFHLSKIAIDSKPVIWELSPARSQLDSTSIYKQGYDVFWVVDDGRGDSCSEMPRLSSIN